MKTLTNQRLFDLVRYMRSELHDAELITDEEYVMLASEHASVQRLEDYDALRAKLDSFAGGGQQEHSEILREITR